jgi:DNA-binding winged helix-turn-helix (wHTH) protein
MYRYLENDDLGLRQKLERDPAHPTLIITISRQGYKFIG